MMHSVFLCCCVSPISARNYLNYFNKPPECFQHTLTLAQMFAYWNFINYTNCPRVPSPKPYATCVDAGKKSEAPVIKIVNIVAS